MVSLNGQYISAALTGMAALTVGSIAAGRTAIVPILIGGSLIGKIIAVAKNAKDAAKLGARLVSATTITGALLAVTTTLAGNTPMTEKFAAAIIFVNYTEIARDLDAVIETDGALAKTKKVGQTLLQVAKLTLHGVGAAVLTLGLFSGAYSQSLTKIGKIATLSGVETIAALPKAAVAATAAMGEGAKLCMGGAAAMIAGSGATALAKTLETNPLRQKKAILIANGAVTGLIGASTLMLGGTVMKATGASLLFIGMQYTMMRRP